MKTNVQYKDRLFSYIFGHESNKAWTLSLYNAINGTSYTDPEEIQITTIQDILYLGMHNDLSFLITSQLNVFEQQSSYNPNMPLRHMQYTGNQYEQYVVDNEFNKYGSKLIPLPAPKLVTFYNGTRKEQDEQYLYLSDSFPKGEKGDIEVRVRMININYGHSREIMEKCEPLREYAWLVDQVRMNQERMDLNQAVDLAIMEMPNDFEILPFLRTHQAEVRGMLLTEYDEKRAMELFRKDGYRDGQADGYRDGQENGYRDGQADERKSAIETMMKMLRDLGFSKEDSERMIAERYPLGEAQ